MSTGDADGIDATLGKLLRALRQPGAPSPDEIDALLQRSLAEASDGGSAGGVSVNRLLQVSQALGAPLFSYPATDTAASTELMAAALSLRLLKAFGRIENAALREAFVRLIERAAAGV